MPLYLWHCAIGFMLSAVFVALLLVFDVAGLAGLIFGSDVGVLAVFLLWFFNGTVFGSVQFAIVVMTQAEDGPSQDDHSGGQGEPVPLRIDAGRSPKRF